MASSPSPVPPSAPYAPSAPQVASLMQTHTPSTVHSISGSVVSVVVVGSVVPAVVVGSMVVVPPGTVVGGSPAVQASHRLAEDTKNTGQTRFCCFIVTFRSRKGFRQVSHRKAPLGRTRLS